VDKTDLSLVVTTYDQDISFLPGLVESIFKSLNPPSQLVVVASGLTEVPSIKVPDGVLMTSCCISTRINQACARNIGIKLSKRKLVCFHDVDDLSHPLRFMLIDKVFKQDPGIDFVIHGYTLNRDDLDADFGALGINIDYHLTKSDKMRGLVSSSGIPLHNSHLTVHKKALDHAGIFFDESTKAFRYEDSIMTESLLDSGLLGIGLLLPLVYYRPSNSR